MCLPMYYYIFSQSAGEKLLISFQNVMNGADAAHVVYTWTRTANIAAPEFLDFGLIGEAVGQVRDFTL